MQGSGYPLVVCQDLNVNGGLGQERACAVPQRGADDTRPLFLNPEHAGRVEHEIDRADRGGLLLTEIDDQNLRAAERAIGADNVDLEGGSTSLSGEVLDDDFVHHRHAAVRHGIAEERDRLDRDEG